MRAVVLPTDSHGVREEVEEKSSSRERKKMEMRRKERVSECCKGRSQPDQERENGNKMTNSNCQLMKGGDERVVPRKTSPGVAIVATDVTLPAMRKNEEEEERGERKPLDRFPNPLTLLPSFDSV